MQDVKMSLRALQSTWNWDRGRNAKLPLASHLMFTFANSSFNKVYKTSALLSCVVEMSNLHTVEFFLSILWLYSLIYLGSLEWEN